MGWRNKGEAEHANLQRSHTYAARGRLEDLGAYLCRGEEPARFMISGGFHPNDRYEPLYPFFDSFLGRYPMVVLHDHDVHMEALAAQTWEETGEASPLWIVNQQNAAFEPFYGMSEQQVTATVRQLAKKLGYTVSPRLERTARAHMAILRALEIPVSLSGFYYLCRFEDMGEFHDNILALPCGEAAGKRIWADLGADGEDGGEQFDLFRTVIFNLAQDARQSGWSDANSVAGLNCLEAIRRQGTLLLSLSDLSSELLLPYLVEEWKGSAHTPFILLIDGIRIQDEQMLDYLRRTNTGCYCGILSENIVDAIQGGEEAFPRLAERMDCFIFYKHGTGKTAEALSEIMGRYEHTRVETSQGTSRGFFHFLPRDQHEDTRFSTENRYRVMPEEITGLQSEQAIVFDASADQIIHFN